MLTKKFFFFFLVLFSFINNCFAVTSSNFLIFPNIQSNTWFVGLGGGYSWLGLPNTAQADNGSNATPPWNNDLFSVTHDNTGVIQAEFGTRWCNPCKFFPYSSLYFMYRHNFESTLNGTVMQYSIPDFLNYNYNISYESDLYTINGKVDLIEIHRFFPYISAGIGAMSNYFYHYSETALPNVTPRISPDFQGRDLNSILLLGAGIDWMIAENIWLTLGYDHMFSGNLSGATGVDSWSSSQLKFGNTKRDTLFLNLSVNLPCML